MFMGCDDLLHDDFVATIWRHHTAHPDVEMIQVGVQVVDDAARPPTGSPTGSRR